MKSCLVQMQIFKEVFSPAPTAFPLKVYICLQITATVLIHELIMLGQHTFIYT